MKKVEFSSPDIFRVSVFISIFLFYPNFIYYSVGEILKPNLSCKINPRSEVLTTWHSLLTVKQVKMKTYLESIVTKVIENKINPEMSNTTLRVEV